MATFELPPASKNLTTFAVYGLIYLLKTSQASPFVTARAKLPFTAEGLIRLLLYIHAGEASLALYRSLKAGQSLVDGVKWAIATYIFGFTSLDQQKLVLKRRAY